MKSTFLLSIFIFLNYSLFAQWTSDTDLNTLVATAVTGEMQSIGTSDGKTYVAFWHDVPAPQYYEMRLQLLDAFGNQLFGPSGMLVNNTVAMSSYTTTWSLSIDRDNNVIIGFNGTDGDNPVYVHKISPDGVQLWGATGINPGSGFDVKLLPLPSGETVVCWLPGNKGVMQKFAADGSAVWPSAVAIEPGVTNHKSSAGELAALSNGDFVVVVHDRGGFSPSSLPYAQRYDVNGTAVWPAPVAISTTYYTAFNRRYPLIQDGDILYFGYSGAQGIQPHGFMQRINPDGTLPWGINGSDFSTQTAFFERDVQIAMEPGSDVVWAICEYSDNAQGQVGEYVQKFDKVTGQRLLTNNGKEIYPVSPSYISHQNKLQTINDLPIFLVSNGSSNGVFPIDLLAVYLDKNGDFAWPEHERPVSTNDTGVKSRIQFNAAVNGQIVAVWTEVRDGGSASLAFAQSLLIACDAPIAGFYATTNSLEAAFSSQAQNAFSILWDFGDSLTGTGDNAIHNYATPGTYTVCQYAYNNCGVDTFCQVINLTMSDVSTPVYGYQARVMPNPNNGTWSLDFDLPAEMSWSYNLFTPMGQLIQSQKIGISSGRQHVEVATDLLPGVYFLHVNLPGRSLTLPVYTH